MPPVVQFSVMFGAGLWTGLVVLPLPATAWLPIVAVGAACARFGWRGTLGAAAAVGLVAGGIAAQREAESCRSVWKAGPKVALLRLHDGPGERSVAQATVLHAREGCRGQLRLRMDGHRVPGGVRVLVVGSYRGSGVFRVGHVRVLHGGRSWRYALRDPLLRRVRTLYGARAGLVEAIVLGRRDDIDPRLREDFVQSGLAHLLAISGLHVGVLAGWCLMAFRLVGLRRRGWMLATAIVWGYVLLLGAPAAATRAAAFVSIYGLARYRERNPPLPAVLAVAVLLLLTVDPRAARSAGAWLSAAAVWGTSVGSRVPRRWRLVGASTGAVLATAPITAFVFGSVAPIGVLANLAAVPLAGMAVPGLFVSLAVGDTLAAGPGLLLAAIESIARWAARLPAGHLVGVPGPAFAAPWLALLLLVLWIRVRRPSLRLVGRRALAIGTAACWIVAVAPALQHRQAAGLSLHFLDVGQGDAIAIRTPGRAWVLIDAGPRGTRGDAGTRIVVPFLRRAGVRRLDLVIASHGDADHLGGMPAVIEALTPDVVLDPGQPLGTSLYLEYLQAVDRTGAEWHAARAGDRLTIDSVALDVLHPSSAWLAREPRPNENSVVMRLTYGCASVLLTGDVGWPAESALVGTVTESSLLKVGHHGSAGSTSDEWLGAVRPRVAVVSVGPNNYGHPTDEVLRRLSARNIPVFRTDRGGTVTVRSDGRYLEVAQTGSNSIMEAVRCLVQPSLRSSGSSSNKKACTRGRRVSLPICSTTSH